MSARQVKDNMGQARAAYGQVYDNIKIKDASNRDMNWVESVCKTFKPDILVLDMGDKFSKQAGFARPDEALKANAIHARQIAKTHNCAVFYMSQLSAEAEGKVMLNQSMMEGSRTGKAAEADLMVLIAKSPTVEGQEEESPLRHINIVKNKLNGWHGMVNCELDYQTARYVG
jgi:RecA-family ATPase